MPTNTLEIIRGEKSQVLTVSYEDGPCIDAGEPHVRPVAYGKPTITHVEDEETGKDVTEWAKENIDVDTLTDGNVIECDKYIGTVAITVYAINQADAEEQAAKLMSEIYHWEEVVRMKKWELEKK